MTRWASTIARITDKTESKRGSGYRERSITRYYSDTASRLGPKEKVRVEDEEMGLSNTQLGSPIFVCNYSQEREKILRKINAFYFDNSKSICTFA